MILVFTMRIWTNHSMHRLLPRVFERSLRTSPLHLPMTTVFHDYNAFMKDTAFVKGNRDGLILDRVDRGDPFRRTPPAHSSLSTHHAVRTGRAATSTSPRPRAMTRSHRAPTTSSSNRSRPDPTVGPVRRSTAPVSPRDSCGFVGEAGASDWISNCGGRLRGLASFGETSAGAKRTVYGASEGTWERLEGVQGRHHGGQRKIRAWRNADGKEDGWKAGGLTEPNDHERTARDLQRRVHHLQGRAVFCESDHWWRQRIAWTFRFRRGSCASVRQVRPGLRTRETRCEPRTLPTTSSVQRTRSERDEKGLERCREFLDCNVERDIMNACK